MKHLITHLIFLTDSVRSSTPLIRSPLSLPSARKCLSYLSVVYLYRRSHATHPITFLIRIGHARMGRHRRCRVGGIRAAGPRSRHTNEYNACRTVTTAPHRPTQLLIIDCFSTDTSFDLVRKDMQFVCICY